MPALTVSSTRPKAHLSAAGCVLRARALVVLLLVGCGSLEATEATSNVVHVQVAGSTADILGRSGARVVEDYGAFRIIAATPEQLSQLPFGAPVEVRSTDNLILLNSGPLDTSAPMARIKALTAAAGPGASLHLVQFIAPVKPEWLAALRASGVKVVSYVPTNAYLVYGDDAALGRLQAQALGSREIRWSGPYLSTHKRPPISTVTEGTYAVQMVEDARSNDVTLSLVGKPVQMSRALGYVNVLLRADGRAAEALAERPDVVSVLPYQTPRLRDERQDVIIAGQFAGASLVGPGYLQWLASKGFTQENFDASGFGVDLSDSGLDNGTTAPNHFGLYVHGDLMRPSRVVYARMEGFPNANSTLAGCDGHGTLNAHIVAGYSDLIGPPFLDAEGYRFGLGVAPFVRVGSSVVFDPWAFTFPVFEDLQSRAFLDGMRVSSNSWGSGDVWYNSDSQRYDALVRDAAPAQSAAPQAGNQEMTIVFAVGNDGSGPSWIHIGSPPNAKNVIAVGASESLRAFGAADRCTVGDDAADSALDVAFFSSVGPTHDGRTKPDIIAPGTHITGGVPQSDAQRSSIPGDPNGQALGCFVGAGVCGGTTDAFYPVGQQWYAASSGTSHSTPAVAGAAALLRQWFINQGLPPPSPAMTKAYLANSARYASGAGGNLPSMVQGMGVLDLGTAFDGTPRLLRDQSAEDVFTATGQVRTFQGIADAARSVRITLAWTDAPGATFTRAAWVNDLDLAVTAGSETYLGNVFAGAISKTGGTPDRKNNLESVFLPPGTGGPFTVTVTAANIAGDGIPGNAAALDQDFALVVTNACVDAVPGVPMGVAAIPAPANAVTVTWDVASASEYIVERADSAAGPFSRIAAASGPPFVDSNRSGGSTYWYRVRARSGCALSQASVAVSAAVVGPCLLPPRFAGLASAQTTAEMTCGNSLSWPPATPSCGGTITYDIHRSTDPSFVPSPDNVIASTDATNHVDSGSLVSDQRYWYLVRAIETTGSGAVSDRNTIARSAAPFWAETLFLDDFDGKRPAEPSAYWLEERMSGPDQLSIVAGCRWQSASASYKFGAPDRCGGGYVRSVDTNFYANATRLVLGGDGTSPLNGFFIPPDAKAQLRFRHWFQFHVRTVPDTPDDGAELLYATDGPAGSYYPVVNPWELAVAPPSPFFVAGNPPNNHVWRWSDEEANGEWREVIVNADALANQTVWFDWQYYASAPQAEEGYYLDDVRLETRRACSSQSSSPTDPVQFRIEGVPTSIVAGTDVQLTITALDRSGQRVTTATGMVRLTSNDPQAVVPASLPLVGGVAQGIMQFRTVGPRALHVTDSRGLAHRAAITRVTAAAPVSIRFSKQPTSFKAGGPMPRTVEVAVEDSFGNGVPGMMASLTMEDNPGGEPWTGPWGAGPAADGHTFFFIGGICRVGSGYTFTATSGPFRVKSEPFDVTPNHASALQFSRTPSAVIACEPMAPAVEVAVVDICGNVTDYSDNIYLALEGSTPLRGNTVGRPSSGVASFLGLSIDAVGADNVLVASTLGASLTPARSAAFDVVSGPARQLVIAQQPAGAVAGTPFLQPLAVRIANACGALITGADRPVSVSLAANASQAHLGGATTVDSAAGVATFVDLTIDRALPGYSLRAEATGLEDDSSAVFAVAPGPATHLSLAGPASVVAGVSAGFAAVARDAQDNASSDFTGAARVTVTDAKAQAPSQVTFNSDGQASFSVIFATPGAQTVSITDLGTAGFRATASIEITPGVAPHRSGCSSIDNSAFTTLLAFALAGRMRKRRSSGAHPRRCEAGGRR